MKMREFEPVIGLEVHAELKTGSKMFCGCSTVFGNAPNTQVCPVCLGLPGVLPVINKKAVMYAVKAGLALSCGISSFSKFDRKNYYYPDLPKNYQVSQYDMPLCKGGYLDISSGRIRIRRAHLEEDAGKLMHAEDRSASFVDYNRAGVPLLEIVTEPDIKSPEDAYEYLLSLKHILEYTEVSDCNMEEGSLRCDANVSVKPAGAGGLGVKTELKNMNSFKGVQKALEFEIKRQADILLSGGQIVQETRLWDAERKITVSMRTKEDAHDYRYFPEPDLPPVSLPGAIVQSIRKDIPELPRERKKRFIEQYHIPAYDAGVLTGRRDLADYFEEAAGYGENPKLISNWIMAELLRELNRHSTAASDSPVSPKDLSGLVRLVEKKVISGKTAKDVFVEMYASSRPASVIIKEKNLGRIGGEDELAGIVDKIIKNNPGPAGDYRGGKKPALMFLVGQVMKDTRGRADPSVVMELLKRRL